MELLCVQGTTISSLDPMVNLTPTPEVSTDVFVDDKPALLSISIVASTNDGFTGIGSINGNSTSNFDNNRPFVLSSATTTIMLARGMTPYPLNPVTVKIDNPNQSSVFMD